MRKFLLFLALSMMFGMGAHAQALWRSNRVELTGALGTTQFFGDIGGFSPTDNVLGFKDLSFRQTRFNITFDISYRLLEDLNLRLNLAYGLFHATDERGSNAERMLEASTSFFEPSFIAEYYVIKNKSENSFLFSRNRGSGLSSLFETLDFYVFAGIGGLAYNVKGNDRLVAFDFPTGGFTGIVPVGIGVNMIYTPEFNFGLELGGRYSFSDLIDGYTSQYSQSNDVYYFLNVTATYKMKTTRSGLPTFRR
jgi:hypothetical protein